VNEDPTEKLINELREENARLRKALESGKIDPSLIAGSGVGAAAGAALTDGSQFLLKLVKFYFSRF
jgi:hypothetical protein